MYIAPTSIVKILRNIPLDNTYKDTLYFACLLYTSPSPRD